MTTQQLEDYLAELHYAARKALGRRDYNEYALVMQTIVAVRNDLNNN